MIRKRIFSFPLLTTARGEESQIKLEICGGRKVVRIKVIAGPLSGEVYSGVDFFWTLGDLRLELEAQDFQLVCKGCLRNTFPGGLLGESSLGEIAVVMDEAGENLGSVNIFDQVDVSEYAQVSSFCEQKGQRKKAIQARKMRGRGRA